MPRIDVARRTRPCSGGGGSCSRRDREETVSTSRVFNWPVGSGRASTQEKKAIGDLQSQNMQLLVGGVTAIAIQHGDLRGMNALQAQALADKGEA